MVFQSLVQMSGISPGAIYRLGMCIFLTVLTGLNMHFMPLATIHQVSAKFHILCISIQSGFLRQFATMIQAWLESTMYLRRLKGRDRASMNLDQCLKDQIMAALVMLSKFPIFWSLYPTSSTFSIPIYWMTDITLLQLSCLFLRVANPIQESTICLNILLIAISLASCLRILAAYLLPTGRVTMSINYLRIESFMQAIPRTIWSLLIAGSPRLWISQVQFWMAVSRLPITY